MSDQPCDVLDVARAFLEHPSCWPCHGVSNLKLHALCYLAQGWTLAWGDRVLTDALFVAGFNGPISPRLRHACSETFSITTDHIDGPGVPLTTWHQSVVDSIATTYGGRPFAGGLASIVTHARGPWAQARVDLPEGSASPVINTDAMRMWFTALDLVS